MNKKAKMSATLSITLIILAVFTPFSPKSPASAQPQATLTGTIFDVGKDTDGNGLYDLLQIGVEINVIDEAEYQVVISGLHNVSEYSYTYISISNNTSALLSSGIQVLNVSLYGAAMHGSHATNISEVDWIGLFVLEGYSSYQIDSEYSLPLGRSYSYEEFEIVAYFTGMITDVGVDSDSDMKFDYLRIDAEINVTKAGNYYLEIQYLFDDAFNYIYVYESMSEYFDVGIYVVTFDVYGPKIYATHLNPSRIGMMRIVDWQLWLTLDSLSNVPLSQQYNYADFESHAYLTETVTDRGVNTDSDGLYNYLEVGIQINVTEAGSYAVYAQGLIEVDGMSTEYLYDYQQVESDFDVGIHTVYLNFEGPRIAYEHFNPTGVYYVSLYDNSFYFLLDSTSSIPLSTRYDYTLFNAPMKDIQIDFVVYPNSTIGVGATANFTSMYPQNSGPWVNATANISTNGATTTGSASGTVILPEDTGFEWPYNSTVANMDMHYGNGLLNAGLNASVFMPPQASTMYPFNASDFTLTSLYSNGLLDVTLHGETILPSLPFNMTDAIVLAEYKENEINGNITFHAVSGFPLGDVIVYFSGNKTHLYLTGHVNVTYGNFFDMIELNSTSIDEMLDEINSTFPGPSGYVYNVTWGLLECTQLNTMKTPWYQGGEEKGADVQFDATLDGNFTGFFARLLAQVYYSYNPEEAYPTVYAYLDSALSSVQTASVELNYYDSSRLAMLDLHLVSDVKALWNKMIELVPPTVPESFRTQFEAIFKIANYTADAIQDFSFTAAYSSATQKLDLEMELQANITELKEKILPILPDTMPMQMHEMVESFVNTTYCELTSEDLTFSYVDGTGNFELNWVLEGDFKAQVNHVKTFYINFLNATSPGLLSELFHLLNETEINVNNVNFEIKLAKDSMYLTFNGIFAVPPKDEIDFIRFKLFRFFNMYSDTYEPPHEFEKLKITVTGGSDATHTVLLYASPSVPKPDSFALDYRSMIWQNTTMSSLKDLLFKVAYQEPIDYLGETYYALLFTNSTMSNFSFDAGARSISFKVAGTTGTGFCNVTIPRSLLYAALGNWTVKIDGTTLSSENFTVTENGEYAFIYLNYTHSEHTIEIIGTWVVTELPPSLLPIFLMILSLIVAVVAVKERKRLVKMKTKYQNAIRIWTKHSTS